MRPTHEQRPQVVKAEPTGECARADQLERRQRLSGAVERLEDGAHGLQLGGFGQDRDREGVVDERLDVGLLHVVQKSDRSSDRSSSPRGDRRLSSSGSTGAGTADARERHHQRVRLRFERSPTGARTIGR